MVFQFRRQTQSKVNHREKVHADVTFLDAHFAKGTACRRLEPEPTWLIHGDHLL